MATLINCTIESFIEKQYVGEQKIEKAYIGASENVEQAVLPERDMQMTALAKYIPLPERVEDIAAQLPAQSPFTAEQIKASGIKIRPDIVLALMKEMQPQCKNNVDWLSFYTVLLRRKWVEENVRAFCRMVGELFGVNLDNRSLSRDLRNMGTDYTKWIESDSRILRRKRLAEEFDRRITEYFQRGRDEVLKGVR